MVRLNLHAVGLCASSPTVKTTKAVLVKCEVWRQIEIISLFFDCRSGSVWDGSWVQTRTVVRLLVTPTLHASLPDLVRGEWCRQPDALSHQQDGGWEHAVHRAEGPDAHALPGGGCRGDQGGCWNSQSARVYPHQ